ncbi:site-specific integrase [Belnapia sp. T6]|uniref:Site-specific integrase n=1 Tax=Belnapia mucosa TaxID=2804532 RepID=A0ABS1VCY3_9PROT|nr:site-specific integrase [Belnapia mucosa]
MYARHAQGALAPETERALRKAALAFTSWAVAQGPDALPAAPETVAAYVDALAAQGKKPASIRQVIWAIATLHRAAGLPDPHQGGAGPLGAQTHGPEPRHASASGRPARRRRGCPNPGHGGD